MSVNKRQEQGHKRSDLGWTRQSTDFRSKRQIKSEKKDAMKVEKEKVRTLNLKF